MSQTEFEKNCQRIVDEWAEEFNEIAANGDNEKMAEILDDVFDVEYRVGRNKSYKSVCVAVAIGGPGIYLDTDDSYVMLYWGSTRTEAPFSYSASEMIDDYFMETLSY